MLAKRSTGLVSPENEVFFWVLHFSRVNRKASSSLGSRFDGFLVPKLELETYITYDVIGIMEEGKYVGKDAQWNQIKPLAHYQIFLAHFVLRSPQSTAQLLCARILLQTTV